MEISNEIKQGINIYSDHSMSENLAIDDPGREASHIEFIKFSHLQHASKNDM